MYSAVAFLLLRKSSSWPLYALPALHHPYKVRTCLAGHIFIPWEELFTIYLYLVDGEKASSFTISPESKRTAQHVLSHGINRENMLQRKNNDLNNSWYQHRVLCETKCERKKENKSNTGVARPQSAAAAHCHVWHTKEWLSVSISHPHPTSTTDSPQLTQYLYLNRKANKQKTPLLCKNRFLFHIW